MNVCRKFKLFFCPLICLVNFAAQSSSNDVSVFGDALLRYENETQHQSITDRERLRLIARLGAHYQLNDNWTVTGRLRTGLKNKQNVPAITIRKFNNQPTPDSDVFVDQFFFTGKWHNKKLVAGKIPWSTWQNTDMFWDRDLNPYGIHVDHNFNSDSKVSLMLAKPLDGNSDTVGSLLVAQWQLSYDWQDWTFKIAPWVVSYSGEENAKLARKDTQIDNHFLRLAINAKYNKWSFGIDAGHSMKSFDSEVYGDYADDRSAFAFEVKYGGLKNTGDFQGYIRYLHVERFGVITEFAQNATQRFGTNDIAGWDLRFRRKMNKHWWLGARLSEMSRLTNNNDEQGRRFRIETQYKF